MHNASVLEPCYFDEVISILSRFFKAETVITRKYLSPR